MVRYIRDFPEVWAKELKITRFTGHLWCCTKKWPCLPLTPCVLRLEAALRHLPDKVKLTSFRECRLPEAPPSMPSAPIWGEKWVWNFIRGSRYRTVQGTLWNFMCLDIQWYFLISKCIIVHVFKISNLRYANIGSKIWDQSFIFKVDLYSI